MIKLHFLPELEQEASGTRKMLEAIPEDKLAYQPHPKSMTLGRLASHVAELYHWIAVTMQTPELNLAGMQPVLQDSKDQILEKFEQNLADARAALEATDDAHLMQSWTLRMGDHVIFTMPRMVVLRNVMFNHIVHHRAQLQVYLRMLDVPVPGLYGPSADDPQAF